MAMLDHQAEALPLKRIMTAAIVAALVMISLVVGSHVVLNNLIAFSQKDAAEINISGRQRMLLQRIANLAQDLILFPAERARNRRQILHAANLMAASHRGLLQGSADMGLPGRPSAEIKAMHFADPLQIDRRIKSLVQACRQLAALEAHALSAQTPQLLLIHQLAEKDLPTALDAVVRQYQQEAEAKVSNLKQTGLVISILFIVSIILIGLFIFWPVIRSARKSGLVLARSEQRYRTTVETMIDGLITIDQQGMVHSFNRAAEQIFGYQADEMIGNNVNMLMPEPDHSGHDGYLRNYLSTGEKKIIGLGREVRGKHKDGSLFPLSLGVSENEQYGEERMFTGVIRDITEQKRAEEAMAAKSREIAIRNRYESSYSKIVALFSGSFDQQEILDGALDVLARQHPLPASAIYLHDQAADRFCLTSDHGIAGALPQSIALGEGVVGQVIMDAQTVILDADEGAKVLSINAGLIAFAPAAVIISPVYYQGKVLAVMIVACSKPLLDLDQTFIERLCGQMGVALNNLAQHQALTDLADQLKRRSAEIRKKNVQLEQISRLKSEFLANMSHELRTPLNAIIGFSEVLKDGMFGKLEAEQQEYIGEIFTSGKHLLSLINDILDLSKIEAGKMELDLAPVNVTEMLRNSVSIIREKAAAHHIQLHCDFGEGMDMCYLDGRKVKQMIYNLLSNAVKFTEDGGQVRLAAHRVKAEELSTRVQQSGIRNGDYHPAPLDVDFLEISVTDTGIGISEEDQQQLFTPFQQLESTLTKSYEGTGLGLVMVKRLARLHGGAVGMESAPGDGSSFTIWLPWLEYSHAVASADPAESKSRHSAADLQKSVLIVEDDEKTAQLMRLQLQDAGYSARLAGSAEQALAMLTTELPDLITLDIMLPGMDGWDFMQALRQQPETAHIPVVVVSIATDSDKGFSLGAANVLHKPVERQALLDAIGKLDFSLQGKRVLVVDDDARAVELVSRHLCTVGCEILKAYGGQQAIAMAEAEKPDIIILDLMMPEVSGFDVIEKLKQTPELTSIPILILTARALSEKDRRQLNGDIVKVMRKSSFNHGLFINEVNRATRRGDMMRTS